MGSPCRVVAPSAELARRGRDLVHGLERSWSRFLPDSEVSRLNRSTGRVTLVSASTYLLVERAEQARDLTAGAFNPLGLAQLEDLGYDRSHEDLGGERSAASRVASPLTSDPIECFPEISGVRLPPGSRFDPGGIGKGLAADIVAAELRRLGAEAAQIELGGDVHVLGPPWVGDQWKIEIDLGRDGGSDVHTVGVAGGGVATSGVTRRVWRLGDEQVHHLIDPATGTSAPTDLVSVTVAAASTWWAEVLAKVAVILGSAGAATTLRSHGVAGVIVPRSGPVVHVEAAGVRSPVRRPAESELLSGDE